MTGAKSTLSVPEQYQLQLFNNWSWIIMNSVSSNAAHGMCRLTITSNPIRQLLEFFSKHF
jgi:hypothetical protein